jgi:hypothetical protein
MYPEYINRVVECRTSNILIPSWTATVNDPSFHFQCMDIPVVVQLGLDKLPHETTIACPLVRGDWYMLAVGEESCQTSSSS